MVWSVVAEIGGEVARVHRAGDEIVAVRVAQTSATGVGRLIARQPRAGVVPELATEAIVAVLKAVAEQAVVAEQVIAHDIAEPAGNIACILCACDPVIAVNIDGTIEARIRRFIAGLSKAGSSAVTRLTTQNGVTPLDSVAEHAVVTRGIVGGVIASREGFVALIDSTRHSIVGTYDGRTGATSQFGLTSFDAITDQAVIA
jgi:hypothetical protein